MFLPNFFCLAPEPVWQVLLWTPLLRFRSRVEIGQSLGPSGRRPRPAGKTLSKFGLINFAREKRGVATAAAKTSGAEGGGQ